LLLHFTSLMPYEIALTLSPSLKSPAAATAAFRLVAAFVPLAGAAGAGFQSTLLGRERPARPLVWLGVAVAVGWIVPAATTDITVAGVRRVAGVWFPYAGPYGWIELAATLLVSLPWFLALAVAALRSPPSDERRQLRLMLAAFVVSYLSLADVSLAWGIGVFPLGWLLSGIGSLLVLRALFVEDLLRARAFDTTGPSLVLHLATAGALGWLGFALVGSNLPPWALTILLALAFVGARALIAIIGLVGRSTRGQESTLDRLLGRLVARSRRARGDGEVAQLAIDIVELGVGARPTVLVAAVADWGWTTATGERVADDRAPDPLLVGWLAEQDGAQLVEDVGLAPDGVRGLLGQLFTHHEARALIPVASRDELLALVLVPASARVRGRALAFVERAAERLGEALVHVRMAQRAAERAALARDVELAAAVQQQLLPGKGPHVVGDVTVVGSWLPATRCAGDYWGAFPLGGGRVLVTIGDVTGHGVASATVTAAAAAACEVVVRRDGAGLDLAQLALALDAAVRRVGGGELAMTLCATILDPAAGELRFVSCGHTAPYLCRAGDGGLELHPLVARGNPLGSGTIAAPKVTGRPLRAGDLVVWYTDGVIDAQDPAGEPFGDRRLQRLLRRLDHANVAAPAVHAVVHAAIAAHRAGQPRGDDETLVVAHWQEATA
jgi:serine phosphatase RsbU (regulator of sigma subunit)